VHKKLILLIMTANYSIKHKKFFKYKICQFYLQCAPNISCYTGKTLCIKSLFYFSCPPNIPLNTKNFLSTKYVIFTFNVLQIFHVTLKKLYVHKKLILLIMTFKYSIKHKKFLKYKICQFYLQCFSNFQSYTGKTLCA